MIIDASEHQGYIDYAKVKAAGVTAAILRVCVGVGKIDSRLIKNAIGFDNEGISVSYYHVVHPDKRSGTLVQDALDESAHLLDAISSLPKPYRLWADCETWDSKGTDSPLTKQEYSQWLDIYLDSIDKSGVPIKGTGLYGSKYYFDARLPSTHHFGARALWLAAYVANPKLPIGWNEYHLWQYTATGKVSGINTDVDLSRLK